MYKKILSVILAGLMLVSFAGCSNKEADKSESNELVLFNAKGKMQLNLKRCAKHLRKKPAFRQNHLA